MKALLEVVKFDVNDIVTASCQDQFGEPEDF